MDGGAKIYPATGYDTSSPDVLVLQVPQTVDMNGIRLTADAIPVTMNNVGYILDRVCTSIPLPPLFWLSRRYTKYAQL